MSNVFGPSHVSRVRVLYKTILRLHRGLPQELKAVGDIYVKEEFRRHKSAESAFIASFMIEWTEYCTTLAKQLGRTGQGRVGKDLSLSQMDELDQQQVGQLYELFQETQKPIDPENPLGKNPNVKQES